MNDRAWFGTLCFCTPPLGCYALHGLWDPKRRDSALGSLEGKGWAVTLLEFQDNLGAHLLGVPQAELGKLSCELLTGLSQGCCSETSVTLTPLWVGLSILFCTL